MCGTAPHCTAGIFIVEAGGRRQGKVQGAWASTEVAKGGRRHEKEAGGRRLEVGLCAVRGCSQIMSYFFPFP